MRLLLSRFCRKLESFPDLFSVDWTIHLGDLREGNVGLAVNAFVDRERVGIGDVIGLLPRYEDDLARYRDYLRATGPAWITKVGYPAQQDKLAEQQALAQLHNRFHQNFFTIDPGKQPANTVLIPILVEILTASTGTNWGFGIAPAGIQPQGTRTPREHLDSLIGLTGLAAQDLGMCYRLVLVRIRTVLASRSRKGAFGSPPRG